MGNILLTNVSKLSLSNGAVLLGVVSVVIVGIIMAKDQAVIIGGIGTLVVTNLLQMMTKAQADQEQKERDLSAAAEVQEVKILAAVQVDKVDAASAKVDATSAKVDQIAVTADATYKLSNSAHGAALQAVMVGLQRIAVYSHDTADMEAYKVAKQTYDRHVAGMEQVNQELRPGEVPGVGSVDSGTAVDVKNLRPTTVNQIVEAVTPKVAEAIEQDSSGGL